MTLGWFIVAVITVLMSLSYWAGRSHQEYIDLQDEIRWLKEGEIDA